MKIRIHIEDLKKTVADMEPSLKGNALPILNSLFITARDDTIRLTMNNLNMQVEKILPGEILVEGNGLLHHDDLSLLLRMKKGVELEFAGGQCTVRGTRIFKFPVDNDADDFPFMATVPEDEPVFMIPQSEMLYALKMRKITSTEKEKEQYRGLWIDKNYVLACDGYRLGKIETSFHSTQKFMLPDCVLVFFAKAMEKKSSPVAFFLAARGYVKARTDDFVLTYRQYTGDFLAYESLFEADGAKIIHLQKKALLEAIDFICKVDRSGVKRRQEPVVYHFGQGTLTLVYRSKGKQVEEEIHFIGQGGGEIDFPIGFDPYYVSDILSMVVGENITMSFVRPHAPSIIQGERETEKYVLTPARLATAA